LVTPEEADPPPVVRAFNALRGQPLPTPDPAAPALTLVRTA